MVEGGHEMLISIPANLKVKDYHTMSYQPPYQNQVEPSLLVSVAFWELTRKSPHGRVFAGRSWGALTAGGGQSGNGEMN